MSIFRRVSFLGFALVSLVVLAACGGDGDGARVELPAPGEYFFDVEANIEFTLTQPEVSAAAVGEVQVHSGQGMGFTGITISTPGGGEQIIGSFGGMQITVDINPGDDGFEIRISQQPDEESTLSEMTEQDGTLGALFIEFELPADRIPGDGEGTATLMNADPLLLGSLQVLDVTEPFTLQGPDGYGPVPLTDDAGQTVGEITAFDLTLNPFDGLVADGADEEPATDEEPLEASCQQRGDVNGDGEVNSVDAALILQLNAGLIASLPCQEAADVNGDGAVTTEDAALILQFTAGFIESFPPDIPTDTEEQGATFTDAEGDEYECDSNEGVDDGDVDVVSVGVTQEIDGVEVRVELRESPPEGKEWFSSSVQVRIGQEGRFQVGQSEVHDGTPNTGRLDDAGQVIPGSEVDVDPEGKFVTFFFPGLDIEEGDTVEVRTFHLEEEGDPVHCDVTDAFPLDELITELCGGECTREE